jgi:hypothetical protein
MQVHFLISQHSRLPRLSKLEIAIPGFDLDPSILEIIATTRKLVHLAITQDHADLLDYSTLFDKIGDRLESLTVFNADQDLVQLIPVKCMHLKTLGLPWLIDPEEMFIGEVECFEYRSRFKRLHTLQLDRM